jgi:hypothetical protein
VLCGSSVHVLDRWQSGDPQERRVGYFYLDAILAYARRLAELPDEAATTELTPPPQVHRDLGHGLRWLCQVETRHERNGWVTGPVRLSGHARVLAVVPSPKEDEAPAVLGTPLYVEYAHHS